MASSGIVEIQMPQMGESVTEGTVLEWHKNEGEFVEEGETVVEVSTDKVDAEVPAPASGKITKVLAQPDETVRVGQVLAEMRAGAAPEGGADGASDEVAVQEAEPATPPASQPAGTAAEGEASGGVVPEDGGGVVREASGGVLEDFGGVVSPVARRIAKARGSPCEVRPRCSPRR